MTYHVRTSNANNKNRQRLTKPDTSWVKRKLLQEGMYLQLYIIEWLEGYYLANEITLEKELDKCKIELNKETL